MSYDALENSVDGGKPYFFYEFVYDESPGGAYRYVADVQQQITGGKTWKPFAIKHGTITTAGVLDKQPVTVTARKDIPLVPMYIAGPPSRVVLVNIYRGHEDDAEIVLEWTGRLLNMKLAGAEAEFTCEPISTSLLTVGLRRKYQRGCPHTLYGSSCRASLLAHTEKGSVTQVVGTLQVRIQLTGASTGIVRSNLIGGIFRVTLATGITEIRAITEAVNNGGRRWTLSLMSQVNEILAGQAVSVSKGCGHTFEICRDTFQNVSNYGGCPNIPMKDPFRYNQF